MLQTRRQLGRNEKAMNTELGSNGTQIDPQKAAQEKPILTNLYDSF